MHHTPCYVKFFRLFGKVSGDRSKLILLLFDRGGAGSGNRFRAGRSLRNSALAASYGFSIGSSAITSSPILRPFSRGFTGEMGIVPSIVAISSVLAPCSWRANLFRTGSSAAADQSFGSRNTSQRRPLAAAYWTVLRQWNLSSTRIVGGSSPVLPSRFSRRFESRSRAFSLSMAGSLPRFARHSSK